MDVRIMAIIDLMMAITGQMATDQPTMMATDEKMDILRRGHTEHLESGPIQYHTGITQIL